ncbi:hypothetical protein BGZ73_004170 [Actinomortierella ambigua]|nr:hypothetical protein BGZ73_004170 [Actinomortierella ambigua]
MSTGSNHPTTSTDHFTLRDEFILQHAEHKNIKQVAQEYFNAFDFSAKGAALDALRASLNATNNNHLAESMKEDDFKKWATRYFALAKEKKKLSIQNIVEKERNKLQITGVLKGSNLIKAGMDLLAPEVWASHVNHDTVRHCIYYILNYPLKLPLEDSPSRGDRAMTIAPDFNS